MNSDPNESRSVFSWSDPDAWRGHVLSIVYHIWGNEVVDAIVKDPPSYIFVGNLHWFKSYLEKEIQVDFETKYHSFVSYFYKTWTHVKAFHGTCIESTTDFYKNGIQPINLNESSRFAIEFFKKQCPRLDIVTCKNALNNMKETYNETDEQTFFAIDKEHLVKHCSHYMLYGSEYLLSFAVALQSVGANKAFCDYRRHLKGRGDPIIFECEIPIRRIPYSILQELSNILISETFRWVLRPEHAPESRRFGFPISGGLKPKHIIRHYSPECLVDPLAPIVKAKCACRTCIDL